MNKNTITRDYLERNCLICQEDHFEILNEFQQEVLVREGIFKFEITEGICQTCGFIYTNPCPTEEFLNLYYRSKHLYRLKTPDYDLGKRIQFLKRVKGDRNTLMEVGSSEGSFLRAAEKLGIDVVGMEPNENVDSISSAEEVKSKNLLFDIIASNHVLEHIVKPLEFLEMLHSLMNENGLLILEVPNLHLYGIYSTGISYEHLSHFSPAHLSYLILRAGFEILEFEFGQTSRSEGFVILAERKNHHKFPEFPKEYKVNKSYYLRAVNYIKGRNDRYKRFIEEILPSKKTQIIAFWGANNILLDLLNKIPTEYLNQIVVVDGNPTRWNTKFHERYPVVILNPDCLQESLQISTVSICAIDWYQEIRESLISMGIHEERIRIPPF